MKPAITEKQSLNPAESWWTAEAMRDFESAAALLRTESAGGRHHRSVYELYTEMEEKDGHLYSILQTRKNGLLGLRRRILPAPSSGARARELAILMEETFSSLPRFEDLLRALLEGLAKGFAVIELIWEYGPDGTLRVADWAAHPQEWFAFSETGALLLLSPPFRPLEGSAQLAESQSAAGRGAYAASRAFTAPERKFIVFRFGADFRNPYGRGLCQRAYWLYWFKKNTLKFWAVYNEKYGAPTAVARYGHGTAPEERRQLRDILNALQSDSGVVLPESIQLEFIEAAHSGNGTNFREFLDWCNDELSKIVLGATLTSGEGRRSGSLALGSIHESVRQDYIESDARLLESVVNNTLMRWIVEANFGLDAPIPRIAIDAEPPEDLHERLKIDQALLSLGVPLPLSYFHETYSRPAPASETETLRFDDANFFKYHLQYGILTINEVRERLGLGHVPWGDERTRSLSLTSEDENLPSPEDSGRTPR